MITPEQLNKIKAFYYRLIPSMKEEVWKLYEERITIRTFKKGELVLKPGAVCNHVSFINHGLLRSYFLVDGKEVVNSFFNEESYFSDYQSFLSRTPCLMYTEALEETELVDLDYDTVQYMYDKIPDSERAGRLVAETLYIVLFNKNASFLLDTPEQRYIKLLEQRPYLFQRVPQYMIASYLGITPEALSRIRSRLSKKA